MAAEPRIIGSAASGCIAGAERLPDSGPGFETIRRGQSSFWAAPTTIAALETLAREALAAGLPTLYMGDLSAPRGGPLPGGHASHQDGLDADVYLDLGPRPPLDDATRATLTPPRLVRADGRDIDPAAWRPGDLLLLRLAASLPGRDRVLVNPAIKRHLCATVTGDRNWLRFIRPWWGHTSHMHIHFRCPADQPECRDMQPPPPGDGCDASLAWWFRPHPAAPVRPVTPRPPPPACRAILAGTP